MPGLAGRFVRANTTLRDIVFTVSTLALSATLCGALGGCEAPDLRPLWEARREVAAIAATDDAVICVTPIGLLDCGDGFSLVGLDAMTGRQSWEHPVRDRLPPGSVDAAPVVAGGVAIVHDVFGDIWAFAADGGGELWRAYNPRLPLPTPVTDYGRLRGTGMAPTELAPFGRELGLYRTGVAIAAGRAYASDDKTGSLLCRDARTGRIQWHVTPAGRATSGICADTLGVYVRCGDSVVRGYSRSEGRLLWESRPDASTNGLEVCAEGIVLRTGDSVAALDAASGREVWRLPIAVQAQPLRPGRGTAVSPGSQSILILADDGVVWDVRPQDGTPRWRIGLPAAYARGARVLSLAAGARAIACLCEQSDAGPVAFVISDADQGPRVLAQTVPSLGRPSCLAAHDRRVYAVTRGTVTCWEVQ